MLSLFRKKRPTARDKGPEIPEGDAIAEYFEARAKKAPKSELETLFIETARQASKYANQAQYTQAASVGEQFAKGVDAARAYKPGYSYADIDFTGNRKEPQTFDRPTGLSFAQLRFLRDNNPILSAVINTRISQVMRFMQPSTTEWNPGFKVRFKSRRREVTDEASDRFDWMERYIMNCGADFDPRDRRALKRDDLRRFMAKHLRDSLTFDAAPTELIPTPMGRIHGFKAVDGARVLLCDPVYGSSESEQWSYAKRAGIAAPKRDDIFAFLHQDGYAVAPYTYENLLYPIRNPDADERKLGYGTPEAEGIVNILTGFLNALEVNFRSITHNSVSPGLLTIFGDYDKADVQSLRDEVLSQTMGVQNRGKLMLMAAESKDGGASYTPFSPLPNEVMYARWITLQVSVIAGRYQMDPTEINFDSYKTSNGALSGSDTEEKLASSRDTGLQPLVRFALETLDQITDCVDADTEIYATGLTPDQQLSRQDEEKMLTLGEFRQRRGEPAPHDETMRDAPMNATHLGLYQQSKQPAPDPNAPMPPGANGQPPQAEQPAADGEARDPRFKDGTAVTDHEDNEYDVTPSDGSQTAPDGGQRPPNPAQVAKAVSLDLERWF